LWHGIGLCVQRAAGIGRGLRTKIATVGIGGRLKPFLAGTASWFFTFVFVSAGWIFFRAETMERAGAVFGALARFGNPGGIPLAYCAALAAIMAFVLLELKIIAFFEMILNKMPFMLWLMFCVAAILAVYQLAPETLPPFIYFSF